MLDRIPPEVFDRILLLCDPIDVITLSQLSQPIHQHIHHNNNLWQRIFLTHFDDSCAAPPAIRSAFESHPSTAKQIHHPTEIDWRTTLITRIILRQVLGTNEKQSFIYRLNKHYSANNIGSLYQLILLILYTARSPLQSSIHSHPFCTRPARSRNLTFLHSLLLNPITQLYLLHLPLLHLPAIFPPNASLSRIYRDDPNLEISSRWAPAKLHTLVGLTDLDLKNHELRGLLRERSYALPNYSRDNLYGPFIPFRSSRVNWCHLRDLSLVMALNLHERLHGHAQQHQAPSPLNLLPSPPNPNTASDRDNTPVNFLQPGWPHIDASLNRTPSFEDHQVESHYPTRGNPEQINWPILNSLQSAIPYTQTAHPDYLHPALTWPPSSKSDHHLDLNLYDWAGVTGKWLRVVCFLDYRDFHAYNFDTDSVPRLENLVEAVRVMSLNLEVVSINDPPDDSHPIPIDLYTGCTQHPPIFFKGTLTYDVGMSSAAPIVGQSVFTLRGCVSMTIDEEVRWSMVSTLGGIDKWSSEGIQVGGVQSKWGVLGAWTDVDRDVVEGPVGPFYFFKTSY